MRSRGTQRGIGRGRSWSYRGAGWARGQVTHVWAACCSQGLLSDMGVLAERGGGEAGRPSLSVPVAPSGCSVSAVGL